MMKKQIMLCLALLSLMLLSGCSGYQNGFMDYGPKDRGEYIESETYDEIIENDYIRTSDMPVSTFSTDVDTASYSNIRRLLNEGVLPSKNAVRIEEMINYFSYEFEGPSDDEDLRIYKEIGEAPWNKDHQLLMVGLKTTPLTFNQTVAMNLVFLIDVSGSMSSYDKLPLLKEALKTLVENLRDKDKLSIVVYAGSAGVVLEGGDISDVSAIHKAIDRLEAGGSTAGGQGIELAYKVAKRQFIVGGNNRIIIASDGDFNVGISNPDELKELVSKEKDSGVFLSVLGFGTGNYRDDMMESIAQNGNGVYYYIDTIKEAEKVLVYELGATMNTVAKDVKIQIEFNPSLIKGYRLIGYENRRLNNEDFNDDDKDAGDLGSGHVVVAFYELVPISSQTNITEKSFDETLELKYDGTNYEHEISTISLRYKHKDSDVSLKIESIVTLEDQKTTNTKDFLFATSVVEFGLLLRNSAYKGTASYDAVIARAENALSSDPFGYQKEFIELVQQAKRLSLRD